MWLEMGSEEFDQTRTTDSFVLITIRDTLVNIQPLLTDGRVAKEDVGEVFGALRSEGRWCWSPGGNVHWYWIVSDMIRMVEA